MNRRIEFLSVADIEVGARHRDVKLDAVTSLVASIKEIGLRMPISVRYYEDRPTFAPAGDTDDCLLLQVGRHRLEAAKQLGWDKIECFVYDDGDEIDAEMWEIAENLHRAELTVQERSEQIARWVELAEKKPFQVETVSKGGRGNHGGVRAAARELNIDQVAAHRAVKIASLSDEAKAAARAAKLDDTQSALLAAAKKSTPAEQIATIHEWPKKTTKAPTIADNPLNDIQAQEKQVAALMAAWNKAAQPAREEFLSRIDRPIMDQRYG